MPFKNQERVSSMLFLSKKFPKNCFTQRILFGYDFLFEFIQRFQQYFLKMKYSFSHDQDISASPLKPQATFLKTFANLAHFTSFQLMSEDMIKLTHVINPNQQQYLTFIPPQMEIKLEQRIEFDKCRCLWAGQEEWILILQDPFKIYVAFNKYKKIVPIILQEDIPLSQVFCFVNYPEVVIYGHNQQNFTNHVYTLHLNTFQVKQLTSSKDYSPGHRSGYWAYFSQGRLYVFGGKDKKGKPCESLFWTYNLQNGNWFALDMNDNDFDLTNKSTSLQLQAGKVLSIENSEIYIVELYQSRARKIQEYDQKITKDILKEIKGLYLYQGHIYLHNNRQLLPSRLKFIKTKIPK